MLFRLSTLMNPHALSSVLSRVTLDNPLALLGERVASVASRVRGSAETMIVRSYAGHDTRAVFFGDGHMVVQ